MMHISRMSDLKKMNKGHQKVIWLTVSEFQGESHFYKVHFLPFHMTPQSGKISQE